VEDGLDSSLSLAVGLWVVGSCLQMLHTKILHKGLETKLKLLASITDDCFWCAMVGDNLAHNKATHSISVELRDRLGLHILAHAIDANTQESAAIAGGRVGTH
jgi:hypothetical protein